MTINGLRQFRLETSAYKFRNWAGNIRAQSNAYYTPSSLVELQELVKNSRKLRLKGSGHSFNDCVASSDTLVCTDRLNKILHIDKDKLRVKVEAGLKLKELNSILWDQGMAFASLGDIAEQSLAGLISTGTHGTGMQWGSFSDGRQIVGVELVVADGSLLELRADRPEDQEKLAAARLALGSLGAIYSITFNLTRAHNLHLKTSVLDLDEACDPIHYQQNDHYEFFPLPFTNRVLAVFRNKTDEPENGHALSIWFNKIVMENYALGALMKLSALTPSRVDRSMRLIAKLAGGENYVGKSYEIMASVRRVRFYEMEYAFPLERYRDALAVYNDINDYFARRKPEKDRYYASFPGEMRFIRGDQDTLLSPTQEKDSCFLAVQVYPSFGPAYEDYFRTMELELRRIGGRPHWGKLFYKNPRELYSGFSRFDTIRKELDPKGKFLNPYMQRLVEGKDN